MSPLLWVFMLLTPFSGFTFTDPADFIFATLIPLTWLGIAWLHFRRPNSEVWVWYATRIAYAFAVLGPLVPLTVLYLASWRASVVLGHWPRHMMDDPKHICHQDTLYQTLLTNFPYATAFGGWRIYSFGALLLHLRRQIPPARLGWMVAAFLLAWMLLVGEPGGRFEWWLD